jgi:hypothetical protein
MLGKGYKSELGYELDYRTASVRLLASPLRHQAYFFPRNDAAAYEADIGSSFPVGETTGFPRSAEAKSTSLVNTQGLINQMLPFAFMLQHNTIKLTTTRKQCK